MMFPLFTPCALAGKTMGTSGAYNHLFYLVLINARNVLDLLKKESCGLMVGRGVIGMPEPSPQLDVRDKTIWTEHQTDVHYGTMEVEVQNQVKRVLSMLLGNHSQYHNIMPF